MSALTSYHDDLRSSAEVKYTMDMVKSNKNARRRRPVRHNKSATATSAIRDLSLATQQILLPQRRDANRMRINHRQIYTFERSYSGSISSTGSNFLNITPASFSNASDFVSLFNRFRIIQVTFEFPAQMESTAAVSGYIVSSAINTSTPNNVTGDLSLQQYDTYLRHAVPGSNVVITRTFAPRVPVLGGITGQQPSFGPMQWYELNQVGFTIDYNGLEVWVQNGSGAVSIPYNVHCVVQFMNPS